MKLFAVIGNPIEHSISPRMHNNALKNLHVNAIYTRYCLQNGKDLRKKFFDLNLNGANITIPFKEDAFAQCDEIKGIARKIKAINTIIKKDDKLIGYNTDAHGFMISIEDFLPLNSALIIGAGGTAKAIAFALKEKSIKVDIVNRSQKRLEDFSGLGFELYHWQNFSPKIYDIIINTTSAGLNDESLPLPKDLLEKSIKNAKFAFDVIYHKQTPFFLTCKKTLTCKNGKDMLLNQGVLALELFLEKKFHTKQIKDFMTPALEL